MTRRTLTALMATAAILALGACSNDDEPVTTATVPPASVVPTTKTTDPATKPAVDPSATSTAEDPDDTGLKLCQQIIKNVQASKLPLSVTSTDEQFTAARKQFTDSAYNDVQKAGEDFIDDFKTAVRAGAKGDVDANELTDSATDLVKACQSHM